MKTDIRPLRLDALEREVRDFEQLYETPSEKMVQAFTVDGRVRETDDLRRWSKAYRTWRSLSEAAARR